MDITHITSLLGGIALFLYGMSIMGAGLEKLAGGKMQGVLQKLTSSTIKGVIFGTLITGVIQSSAGTVVICVGLVNSGIMTLTQSVGVIMGANIGTTVTGQLIRMADISGDSLWLTLMQPKTFAPVVAFIGCIFYVFLRNAKKKNIGQIMLGFGILFTGMSLMDTGVSPLRESAAFQNLFVTMTNPILGVLVGLVVTVLIQSSSASVGILQALSSTGLVTFSSAIPIILGAHIGTAFTPLLTIGGSSKDGKRAALIHLYFNVIGSIVLLALIYAVQFTFGIPMWHDVMNKSSIANIHTLSSVCAMLLFLPCSGVLSKLAMLTVPDNAEEAQELSMPVLDERLFKSPAVALQQAKNAVVKMSRRAARNVNLAAPLLLKMDLDATFESDPAAASREEIIFAYPGLFAIFVYRIAHLLYCQRVPMIPRIMAEYAHSRTGIDIHPGASIGPHFFIDHGTGIVVGETTVIGRNVKLYQGVTLGAMSPRAGHASLPGKRHPTVGDDVTIYSGASILGGETDIGDGSVVGGNVFLTHSVRSGTRVAAATPAPVMKNPSDPFVYTI